jgi:hypothetical protein
MVQWKETWFDRQSLIEKYAIIANLGCLKQFGIRQNKEGIKGVNF